VLLVTVLLLDLTLRTLLTSINRKKIVSGLKTKCHKYTPKINPAKINPALNASD
jgi:hypothetical protein